MGEGGRQEAGGDNALADAMNAPSQCDARLYLSSLAVILL